MAFQRPITNTFGRVITNSLGRLTYPSNKANYCKCPAICCDQTAVGIRLTDVTVLCGNCPLPGTSRPNGYYPQRDINGVDWCLGSFAKSTIPREDCICGFGGSYDGCYAVFFASGDCSDGNGIVLSPPATPVFGVVYVVVGAFYIGQLKQVSGSITGGDAMYRLSAWIDYEFIEAIGLDVFGTGDTFTSDWSFLIFDSDPFSWDLTSEIDVANKLTGTSTVCGELELDDFLKLCMGGLTFNRLSGYGGSAHLTPNVSFADCATITTQHMGCPDPGADDGISSNSSSSTSGRSSTESAGNLSSSFSSASSHSSVSESSHSHSSESSHSHSSDSSQSSVGNRTTACVYHFTASYSCFTDSWVGPVLTGTSCVMPPRGWISTGSYGGVCGWETWVQGAGGVDDCPTCTHPPSPDLPGGCTCPSSTSSHVGSTSTSSTSSQSSGPGDNLKLKDCETGEITDNTVPIAAGVAGMIVQHNETCYQVTSLRAHGGNISYAQVYPSCSLCLMGLQWTTLFPCDPSNLITYQWINVLEWFESGHNVMLIDGKCYWVDPTSVRVTADGLPMDAILVRGRPRIDDCSDLRCPQDSSSSNSSSSSSSSSSNSSSSNSSSSSSSSSSNSSSSSSSSESSQSSDSSQSSGGGDVPAPCGSCPDGLESTSFLVSFSAGGFTDSGGNVYAWSSQSELLPWAGISGQTNVCDWLANPPTFAYTFNGEPHTSSNVEMTLGHCYWAIDINLFAISFLIVEFDKTVGLTPLDDYVFTAPAGATSVSGSATVS